MFEYIFLLAIYCGLLVYILVNNKQDSFSPPVLFVITMSFYTLPDMFSILDVGIDRYTYELPFKFSLEPQFAIYRFMVIQIAFISAYYLSYKYYVTKPMKTDLKKTFVAGNKSTNILLAVTIIIVCVYGTINYYMQRGGLLAVFMSFTNRSELAEEAGFLMTIIPGLMTFALAFGMKYCSQKIGSHKLLYTIFVLLGFFTLTSGGGRSAFVVYVLSLFCYYHIWIRKVDLFSFRLLPVYCGLALFIIVFQFLRFEGTNDLSDLGELSNSEALFNSMAYMKTQLLIQNYFDNHSFWYGRIYTFLLYIFIPRSLCPTKPFIDEGSYIYNMIDNPIDVLSTNYFYNSWPPFTCGISYANFGFIGVILGGVIIGYLHSYIYRRVNGNKESLLNVVLYIFLVLKFQLTIYYIANLSYLLIQCWLFRKLYTIINRLKKCKNENNITN